MLAVLRKAQLRTGSVRSKEKSAERRLGQPQSRKTGLERLLGILAALKRERTSVALTGKRKAPAPDLSHGSNFRRGSLSIGQVALSDLLFHRHHDALPADHRAQGQGHRHLHPNRNEPLGPVDVPFVESYTEGLLRGG